MLLILSKFWWSPQNKVVYLHHKFLVIAHLIVLSVNGQCYAEKQARGEVSQELLETQVNPVVWEIGGDVVLKRRRTLKMRRRTMHGDSLRRFPYQWRVSEK